MGNPGKKVSVVVACRNEAKYIKSCIQSVLKSNYPSENIEIILVDGMSDDGTRKVIEEETAKNSNIKMVDNVRQLTPFAFNLGIKNAIGEYIIIMGGRHNMSENYISTCVNILDSDAKIACAGGKVDNVFENNTSKIIAAAMASAFGVGGGNFRTLENDGFVDTVGTPVFRKSIFDEIGLFDERLARNQDDEFSYRLIKQGYKIYFTSKAYIRYYVRANYKNLLRQYYQYGYWKVFVNKKHHTITTLRQVVPAAFVLFVFFGLLTAFVFPWFKYAYAAVMLLYIGMAFVVALVKCKERRYIFNMVYAFLILHFGYGSGYIEGIINFLLLNRVPAAKQSKLSR